MKKLKREVQAVAKPFLKQIEDLNSSIRNKQGSLASIQTEIDAKQKKAAELEAGAKTALGGGDNPVGALRQAATLKNEAESLSSFLLDAGDCAKEDEKEVRRLKNEMLVAVRDTITGSTTMKDRGQEFKDALVNVCSVVDEWNDAVKNIYVGLDLTPVRHQLLTFEDGTEERELSGRIGNMTHPYQHILV